MTRRQQPHLPGFESLGIKEFGGALLKGNPREARPISTKRPIHLVMRSSLARGEHSFLRPGRARHVQKLVHELARRKGVKIYRFANSGNHLHFVLLARSRESFRAYLRALTGILARVTLGVERGRARAIRFWDARPFTRVLEWGRDFRGACAYLLQNELEAIGFVAYRPRKLARGKTRSLGPPGTRSAPR